MLKKMSNADYHAHPAIARSMFNKFFDDKTGERLPLAIIKTRLDEIEEPNAAMKFGTACHTYMLESEKIDEEVLVFDQFSSRKTKAFEKCELENPEKTVIHISEKVMLDNMLKVFSARGDIQDILKTAQIEMSAFWIDPWSGIECKARADIFTSDAIYDYKTTSSLASERSFRKTMKWFGYHRQAAWYLDGFNKATQSDIQKFRFIVQEKSAPYLIGTYEIGPDLIEEGRLQNAELMEQYVKALSSDEWPGYPTEFVTLSAEAY